MGLSVPILLPSGRQARFNSNQVFAQYCHAAFPLVPSRRERLAGLLRVDCDGRDFDWGQLTRVPHDMQPPDTLSLADIQCLEQWLVGATDGNAYLDDIQAALRVQIRGLPTERAFDVPWTLRLPERIRALPMRRAPALQWAHSLLNLTKGGIAEDELMASGSLLSAIVMIDNEDPATGQPGLASLLAGRVWNRDAVLRELRFDNASIDVRQCVRYEFSPSSTFYPDEQYFEPNDTSAFPEFLFWHRYTTTYGYRIYEITEQPRPPWHYPSAWMTTDEEGNFLTESPKRHAAPALAAAEARPYIVKRYQQYARPIPTLLWETYQIPGGINSRELLLTIPNCPNVFLGNHFKVKNVFCHLRLTDRRLGTGERFLFIEEVQSDWKKALRAERRSGTLPQDRLVPDCPLERRWLELGLKLALYMAAREGYAGIGWSPGHVQAARFPSGSRGLVDLYDRLLPWTLRKLLHSWSPELDIAAMGAGPDVLNVPVLRLDKYLRATLTKAVPVFGPIERSSAHSPGRDREASHAL